MSKTGHIFLKDLFKLKKLTNLCSINAGNYEVQQICISNCYIWKLSNKTQGITSFIEVDHRDTCIET